MIFLPSSPPPNLRLDKHTLVLFPGLEATVPLAPVSNNTEVHICVRQHLDPPSTGHTSQVVVSSVLTEGSSEMIRTVLSASPTARNRERCSPGGTLARLMHTTSADISFRSVYSFSWPD